MTASSSSVSSLLSLKEDCYNNKNNNFNTKRKLLNRGNSFNVNNRSRYFIETNFTKYSNDLEANHPSNSINNNNKNKNNNIINKHSNSCASLINENIPQQQQQKINEICSTKNKFNELFLLPPRPISSAARISNNSNKISPSGKSNNSSSMENINVTSSNRSYLTTTTTSGFVTGSQSSIFTPSLSSLSPRSTSPNTKAQMPFKIRSSKYRHVYGNPHKEDFCYKNIKITRNAAHDSAFCAINPKFVAIVTEECGGGAFVVVPIKQTGRVDTNLPKVSGHRGPVLDLKWNPFNDNEIASCSEDTTIKVWQIDDDGLYENLNQWIVDLHGHQRRVTQIEWHPTAENIMISCGADFQVLVWNLEKAEPIRIINCHTDTIQSMSWNRNGSLFATTCKDKKIRIIDPRTGTLVNQFDGHQGAKTSKVIMLGCGTKLFTTGFSKLSERQLALWDMKDLSKPLQMDLVDPSSGALIPYYDHESKIVYIAGKGDGNIRYYEITDSEPYIHYLSEYKSSTPQRGLGFMPKRGLDVTKNEIFRFYKLHATGNLCEPISMIVPRKAEVFQEDIYPDTASGIPSMSCDEWINGENREPILVSMKDGAVAFMPKIITYKQLGFSDLGNGFNRARKNEKYLHSNEKSNTPKNSTVNNPLMPFVESQSKTLFNTNNNKSAFNKVNQLGSPSPTNQLVESNLNGNYQHNSSNSNQSNVKHDTISENMQINDRKNDLETNYVTNLSKNPVTLRKTESLKLESVQNIRNRFNRVSSHHIGTLTRNHRQSESGKDYNNSNENLNKRASNTDTDADLPPPPPNLVGQSPILSYKTGPPSTPTPLILSTASLSSSSSSSSTNNGIINSPACVADFISYGVKKRVWTPIQSNNCLASKSADLNGNGIVANNLSELQKSYFRILDEKNSLKEQLNILETKNKQLEEELSSRDKRIESLENRVNKFLTESLKIKASEVDISDC